MVKNLAQEACQVLVETVHIGEQPPKDECYNLDFKHQMASIYMNTSNSLCSNRESGIKSNFVCSTKSNVNAFSFCSRSVQLIM